MLNAKTESFHSRALNLLQKETFLPKIFQTAKKKRVIPESQKLRPENLSVSRGLGEGGFGVVVKVEDFSTAKGVPKVFAMKCVDKTVENIVDNMHEKLSNELCILSKISPHPFLLRCHLAFESPTTVNFVTDFVGGGDLFFHLYNLIKKEKVRGFKEDQARFMLSEMVLGLCHLHKHHFIHFDLKVENVMLDSQGHVKLIDFGLAGALKGGRVRTKSKKCSLTYLPPEILAKGGYYGRHTDWWGLGAVAFELLYGIYRIAHAVGEFAAVKEIRSLCSKPPNNHFSLEAGDFVRRLLTKDYKHRLGTARDSDVLKHKFFAGVDWEATMERRVSPGFVPEFSPHGHCLNDEAGDVIEKYKSLRVEPTAAQPAPSFTLGLENVRLNPDLGNGRS